MNLVIYSERLALKPYHLRHYDLAVEMFTDPEVLRFSGGALEKEQIRNMMGNWTRRGGDGCIGIWCVSDRQSSEKLGTVALLPIPIEDCDTDYSLVVPGRMPDGDVEIGYYLKRAAWDKGYATEACKALLAWAFEESLLGEIVATFDPGNNASRHVLEKSGFNNRGTMRCYGGNGLNYRIGRDEWLSGLSGVSRGS